MNIFTLFTRTVVMMFSKAALWVVAASMLLITLFFSRLLGGYNAITMNLTSLVSMAAIAILVGAVMQIFNEMAEGRNPSIIDGFSAGWRRALPLMLLQLIWQVPMRLVVWIVSGVPQGAISPAGSPETLTGSSLIYLVGQSFLTEGGNPQAFLYQGIILLAILVAGAFAIGTDRAVVLEDLPVPAALARGWELLRGRFSSYIRIGLATALVTLVLGLLVALLQSLVIGPAAFGVPVTEAQLAQLNANPLAVLGTALNLAFSILELILITGVWTLAFRGWQGKDAQLLAQGT